MTTMEDVVAEARRYLHGGLENLITILDANLSSTTGTSVKVGDDLKGVGRGSILEIGLEQMYVRSLDENAKTAVVIRGHNGTVATPHSAGETIVINPFYAKNDIFRACLDEISSLQGSGLYQFDTQEFDYDQHDKAYDLTLSTENRTPLFVQRAVYEKSQRFQSWAPTRVELLRDMDTGDFSSGYALKVVGRPRHAADGRFPVSTSVGVRATIAFSLGRPSALSDDVLDFGLEPHIVPIIAVGAAWRMIIGKEARRLNPDVSHGSRRSEEIQGGSIAFLGRALNAMRNDLIEDAIEHQMKRYPYMQEGT